MKKILIATACIGTLLATSLSFADVSISAPGHQFTIKPFSLPPGLTLKFKGQPVSSGSLIKTPFTASDFKIVSGDYSKLAPMAKHTLKIPAVDTATNQQVIFEVGLPKLPSQEQAKIK